MRLVNILLIASSLYALGMVVGCKKSVDIPSTPSKPPVVTTKAVTNISSTFVVSGGELADTTNITDKGVIWGTDSSVLVISSVHKVSNRAGGSSFTDTIENLQPNTTYYVRAYAVNSSGVGYGATLKFTTLPPQPTVYITGYNGGSAVYWKNGKVFPLSEGTFAHSVFVAGNDVYMAGEHNGAAGLRAMYWKNGTAVALTNGSNAAVAKSIYVVGNDVYVAGYELFNNDPNLPVAKYWKNGVAVPLTAGTSSDNGIAYSICVVGSDVYVAGYTRNLWMGTGVAMYWKNGTGVALSDSNKVIATALSIFVKDNDVYVAGQEKPGLGFGGVPVAKYWKNGKGVSLTDGNLSACAYSIYVTGNDVYVAGDEEDGSTGYSIAKYWKNGTPSALTSGTQYDHAGAIRVVGDDVYVTGWESDGISYGKAKYWKNGISLPLEISAKYSTAVSVFVQ